MSQSQKDKIAASNVGKHLSQITKDKISRALTKYWSRLPYKPEAPTSGTTADSPTGGTYLDYDSE